jgi:hypothetical protein
MIARKMRELQATDRWTFVFRVPRGYARELARLGIPADNILEWDQTARGVEVATRATESAFDGYFQARAMGATSTKKFYADSNMAKVDLKTVQANLVDISSLVNIWMTSAKETIAPYCERMSGKPFIKGAAFYQLVKTESDVQDYKKIVIRHKATGAVYGGDAARQLLSLPLTGTCGLRVGDNGDYDVYVQSTSVNRVLPPGTTLLYWPTHTQTHVAPTTPVAPTLHPNQQAAKKTVASGKTTRGATHGPAVAPKVSADFVAGYKAGFQQGKAKLSMTGTTGTTEYALGFRAGYKDGRGKKKNLYK